MSAPEEKVAAEVAEAEFRRWLDAMGLAYKVDDAKMNDEDRASLEKLKQPILNAIGAGRLACNEACEFVFTPQLGDVTPITFYEPDGAAIMQMDKVGKKDENVVKMYGVLAAITRQNPQRFTAMKNRDLAVCRAVFAFFLAG